MAGAEAGILSHLCRSLEWASAIDGPLANVVEILLCLPEKIGVGCYFQLLSQYTHESLLLRWLCITHHVGQGRRCPLLQQIAYSPVARMTLSFHTRTSLTGESPPCLHNQPLLNTSSPLCLLSWDGFSQGPTQDCWGNRQETRQEWQIPLVSILPLLSTVPCTYSFSIHEPWTSHQVMEHHFIANRWENNGNSDRLSFSGLPNHCRWWLQPWN